MLLDLAIKPGTPYGKIKIIFGMWGARHAMDRGANISYIPPIGTFEGQLRRKFVLSATTKNIPQVSTSELTLAIPKVDHTQTTPDIRDTLITQIKGQKKTQMELYVMISVSVCSDR